MQWTGRNIGYFLPCFDFFGAEAHLPLAIMADIMFCKLKVSFVIIFAYFWSTAWSENFLCPSVCSCLGHMVDCSKRNLDTVPTDLPTWVKILDLSSNRIIDVLPSTFQGLTNLDELNLSGNKIRLLNSELFTHFRQLKTLKLMYNELDELPTFPVNYSLTHLLLSHNKLRSLSKTLLRRTPLLRQLDVGFNKLTELTNGTFPFLPNLHQLYLNNNRITKLAKGTLDNLPNLEMLRLGKNQIGTLPAKVFKKLSQLKLLDLYRNKLEVIAGLTFSGLEKLSTLKLKRNNITQLSDGAFWGLSNINTLELDNNSLTQLKKAGLYGLESLKSMSLTHNHITYIEPGCWEFCPHLTTLQLSHNALEHINKDTLSKLTSLHSLWLNNNRISYIDYKAFSDLYSLETLELNSNQISWTIEDMHGPFDGLVSLRRLSLEWNHIKSVTAQSFEGLDQLRQLELGHNEISSLQNNAFVHLKELQSLSLNTSALLCDCKLEWFAHWLDDTGFMGSVSVKCAHPQLLRGVSLMDVSQFKCEDEDFLMPVILKGPAGQIALKGSNFTLECLAASSSKSTMEIHWRKDNVPINNAKINTTATLVDELVSMSSTMVITTSQFEDAGAYQCVATNDIGPTYSTKANIAVHIFPVFTKTPKDVTKKAGLKIELECAATGEPAPEISWQKDGGDDFPAARERRMHVQPDQDIFFISSVKIEDMGVYSCTASNAAGTVVTNATVTVLEVPKFAEPMRDLEVEGGDTAVLECMAQGSPTPRLEWLKNDKPLTLTERHFFTAEDQLLVIVEATPEDSGKYTCIMTNTLGSERGTLALEVLAYGGGKSGGGPTSLFSDNSTTTGIIIIAVVCCVVGTSLIWVVIIYQTRRKNEEYSSTPTEETNVPEVGGGYSSGEEKDRSKLRTIYTSSGARVYMNGGSGLVHMNGGFNITNNPLEEGGGGVGGESWEPGRGEFEQDSREHLMISPSSQLGHIGHISPVAVGQVVGVRRPSSSVSVVSDSHSSSSSSSSPGTHSTQSTMVLSTFHPHLSNQNSSAENSSGEPPPLQPMSPPLSECRIVSELQTTGEQAGPVSSLQEDDGTSYHISSTFPHQQQAFVQKTNSYSHLQKTPQQPFVAQQDTACSHHHPSHTTATTTTTNTGQSELDTNHNNHSKQAAPPQQDCNSNPHLEPHIVIHRTDSALESHTAPPHTQLHHNGAPNGDKNHKNTESGIAVRRKHSTGSSSTDTSSSTFSSTTSSVTSVSEEDNLAPCVERRVVTKQPCSAIGNNNIITTDAPTSDVVPLPPPPPPSINDNNNCRRQLFTEAAGPTHIGLCPPTGYHDNSSKVVSA